MAPTTSQRVSPGPGKETSTLAFRLPEGGQNFLLRSSVVDSEVPRLLVHREVTDSRALSPSEKRSLGPLVVGPEPVPVPSETVELRLRAVAVRSAPD